MKKRSNSSMSSFSTKQASLPRNLSKELLALRDPTHEESKTGVSSSQNSSCCSSLQPTKHFIISGANYAGIVYPQGVSCIDGRTGRGEGGDARV